MCLFVLLLLHNKKAFSVLVIVTSLAQMTGVQTSILVQIFEHVFTEFSAALSAGLSF